METEQYSYLNPKIEMRSFPQKGMYGLFASAFIPAGELLSMWGGRVLTTSQYDQLPPFLKTHGLQIEDDLFQVPLVEGDPADYFNHCCDPNAGFGSPISLIAMRGIQPGEEICFDYAMSEDNHFDEFPCGCGAANCRGQVTGKDWLRPELQERYFGFFSPYLQRRLEKMRTD
ncbi:MAG: SET domain-containing protein-lysine N-methyltransferase [Chloroflexi bacterium HGW-Chloroflexi-10]|nr:MAG: SET domain-containing protein-lysine N-methyltransferase [Chloroflexi bacterium HGW-Chloroflexi-10]